MSTEKYTPRLAEKYKKETVPALMKKFAYKSVMQTTRRTRIGLSRGLTGTVGEKNVGIVGREKTILR